MKPIVIDKEMYTSDGYVTYAQMVDCKTAAQKALLKMKALEASWLEKVANGTAKIERTIDQKEKIITNKFVKLC